MSDTGYGAGRVTPSLPPTETTVVRSGEPGARHENGAATSPFRSQEAFDAYCGQVQARLAEHAAQRSQFLRTAHDRLTRLLYTARAVEDTNLYNELWQHRVAVKELLDALAQTAAPTTAWPTVAPPGKPVPIQNSPGSYIREVSVSTEVARPLAAAGIIQRAIPQHEVRPEPEPAPRLPRHPVRPLVDIEADAIRQRTELREWSERYPLRRDNGALNIPNALRLRALACRQRRLEEEAGDTEVAEVSELRRDIVRLLDDAGDKEYTVTLDYDLEPRPTAFQWSELAERHEETARAQEAFEWWLANRSNLTVADVQPLAEAVAAIQQRFNRLLFRIGARDPFQQQLFDDLRAWAKEAQCYLYSLRPKVPIAELVEKASSLEAAWSQAKGPLSSVSQRLNSLDTLVMLVSAPDFSSNFDESAVRLRDTLQLCLEDGTVSTSDRRLRETLLPWIVLLEGDERFQELVDELYQEWEQRLESGRTDSADEESEVALQVLGKELDAVRGTTRASTCVMLGGICREDNRRRIQQALQLEGLAWPTLHAQDDLGQFDQEIAKAKVVVMLTRYSRKDWHQIAERCAQEGKRFIRVPNRYSPSFVVRALHANLK